MLSIDMQFMLDEDKLQFLTWYPSGLADKVIPHTVSELLQIIGQIFIFEMGVTLVQGEPQNLGPQNLASRH